MFAAKPAVILRDFDKSLQILQFFKQNVNKILRELVKFKIKMNTTNANYFQKILLIFFQIHKKNANVLEMHRFISNFLCFCAANAAVSAAKWVATLHDFGKNDHVFESFCEILSKFDTSLANRKQKKTSLLQFFFQIFC